MTDINVPCQLQDFEQENLFDNGVTFGVVRTVATADRIGLSALVDAQAGQFSALGTTARCSAEADEEVLVHLRGVPNNRYTFRAIFAFSHSFEVSSAPSPDVSIEIGFGGLLLSNENFVINQLGSGESRRTLRIPALPGLDDTIRDGDLLTVQFRAELQASCRAEPSKSARARGVFGTSVELFPDLVAASPVPVRSLAVPSANSTRSPDESSLVTQAGLYGLQVLDQTGEPVDLPPDSISVESAYGTVPVFGANIPGFAGTDDFGSVSKDEEKWGPTIGAGKLSQVNQRLEYTSESDGENSAQWNWIQDAAPYPDDWDLITDVFVSDQNLPTEAQVAIGLGVTSGTNSASIVLDARKTGGSIVKRYRAQITVNGQTIEQTAPAATSSGSVRLHFNGTTKELSFWFDPDGAIGGYNWQSLSKADLGGKESWALNEFSWFHANLFARSFGLAVPPGQAYADNFFGGAAPIKRPTLFPAQPDDESITLRGTAQPHRFLTIETSDDLKAWLPSFYSAVSATGEFSSNLSRTGRQRRFYRVRY